MFGCARARSTQRAFDLAPRGVAVVQDAAPRVAALAAEREAVAGGRAGFGRVEVHAELHERLDDGRRALDHELHDVLVAEARARGERVAPVGVEGVVVGEDGGDAALRPAGGGILGALAW